MAKTRNQTTRSRESISPRLVIAGIVVVVVAIGAGSWLLLTLLQRSAEEESLVDQERRREVAAYEQAVRPIDARLGDAGLDLGRTIERFQEGLIGPEDFRAQVNTSLAMLNEALAGFNDTEPPRGLEEVQALFAYGTSSLIDAARHLLTLPEIEDPEERAAFLGANRSLRVRAFDVVNIAKRMLEEERQALGLGSELSRSLFILDPIPLPSPSPAQDP